MTPVPASTRSRRALALAAAVSLGSLTGACSNPQLAEPTPEIAAELATTTTEAPEAAVITGAGVGDAATTTLVGDGRSVVVGVGDRPGDQYLAALAADSLALLGFEVPDPVLFGVDPRSAALALGEGDLDVWVGRWRPLDGLVDPLGTDGEPVGERLVEAAVVAEVTVGFAVAAPAEPADDESAAAVPSLWELLTDSRVAAAHDHDGDGRAELWSCPPESACAAWVDEVAAVLPSDAGFEADIDDFVQFADTTVAPDPTKPMVVLSVGNPRGPVTPVDDAAGELSAWLVGGVPVEEPTTTVRDGLIAAPGPIEVEVMVAVGAAWADAEPEALAALETLAVDDEAYRASWSD